MTAKKTVTLRVADPFTSEMRFPSEDGETLVITRAGTEVAKSDAADLVARAAASGVRLLTEEDAIEAGVPVDLNPTGNLTQPTVDNGPVATPTEQE